MYHLGVDLGTTFTAAAVWRDGRVEVCSLGNRAPAIPSVVLLREDEEVLTGEAADRRGATEPHRVAREFKRRVGDPTPMIVGGAPYSADALTAKLLRSVLTHVAETEGRPPTGVAVCHPANWGDYKKDLLRQAITLADLDDDVTTITEPEAAAIHYASQERVEPGAVIAVYDLGGGTFDAAVLRKAEAGWEILGEPQGVERLGGVDFDEAVFQHVIGVVGEPLRKLEPDDPTARAAVARLRQDCAEAKEALSADTDVSIPVLLPTIQTEVRLTRAELEQMVRPRLGDSITALRRALRLADVEPDDVTAVLLVGGSSRIPLVAQLVGSELGRPVAVDAHPKYGIALGAAMIAAEHSAGGAVVTEEVREVSEPALPAPLIPVAAPDNPVEQDQNDPARPATDVGTAPVASLSNPGGEASGNGTGTTPAGGNDDETHAEVGAGDAEPTTRVPVGLIVGGIATLLVLIVAFWLLGRGDDEPPETVAGATETEDGPSDADDGATETRPDDVTTGGDASAEATDDGETESEEASSEGHEDTADDTGEEATERPEPFVQITGVDLEGDAYRVHFQLHGFTPSEGDPSALHTHFFLSPSDSPENVGTNGQPPGDWHLSYSTLNFLTKYGPGNQGNASQICATVADSNHAVHDREGELNPETRSGNCWDLPR